ncbi:MAG: FAD-dependent oxidoreductase, partial [Candidatus Cloacimonadaceae bacterium]|nr:FAD-dependent oxidoreductase [Candidatus Cloacimonadaceae bacterium]
MSDYQVLIIGGGPGGYETAVRLSQYGISAAVIEKDRIGGICLNWGCIPTKALVK